MSFRFARSFFNATGLQPNAASGQATAHLPPRRMPGALPFHTAAIPFLLVSTAALLIPTLMAAQAPAPAAKPAKYSPPRLADGRPDFSGFWTNNTATPLQRPDSFQGREYLRPDEVAAIENSTVRKDDTRVKGAPCAIKLRPGAVCPAADGGGPGDVGDYNAVFLESGKKVVSTLRTSIIIDPKDGKLPPMTEEAKRKMDADAAHQLDHPFDGPEDLSAADRCLSGTGIPMLPYAYNNTYQIVQSHDFVAIVAEVMHDQRIIPVDGRPHGNVRQWMGDSVGHYAGDTLVVETTNFNGKRGWPLLAIGKRTDGKLKITERFTRTAPDILLYQFTVDDPGMYTRPYMGEITMWSSKDPVYEYGCHEGNYSMPLILSGARADEQAAATKKGK